MNLVEKYAMPRALTRSQTIDIVNEMAFFLRSGVHVLTGLVPALPAIEDKLAVVRCLAKDAEMADSFQNRLESLRIFDDGPLGRPQGAIDLARILEQAPDEASALAGLRQVIRPGLISTCQTFLEGADQLMDAKTTYLTRRTLHFLETLTLPDSTGNAEFLARVESGWAQRNDGETNIEEFRCVAGPKLVEVARPEHCEFGVRGASRPLFWDLLRNKEEIARFVHQLMDNCLLAAESISRFSHEAPYMSYEFHREMAAQAASSVRQYRMLERALTDMGYKYGDFTLDRSAYELFVSFQPCEAGSPRELLWRLLLKITWFQANELGPFQSEYIARSVLEQEELAKIFGRLTCDAVEHVRVGLKWVQVLCDGDAGKAFEERKAVVVYLEQVQLERRARYMVNHPKQAIAEMKEAEEITAAFKQKSPEDLELSTRRFSFKLRRAAGFPEEEILWAAEKLGHSFAIEDQEAIHAV